MANDNGIFINWLLSSLLKKTYIPADFHSQVKACKEMQYDDVSGLVDVLTDYSVENASVNYGIETDNDNFTQLLKKWLDNINLDYVGIPTGINPLSEEYFKERWKSSSFPILKLAKWENIGQGIIAPTKMFFVDGEFIQAQDKSDSNHEKLNLVNYDYFLGSSDTAEKLDKNVIITRPFARWYEKYPTPYLIKRGVYHNWMIIKSLKNKETEILDQIIPYMLLIKKGTERLALEQNVVYSDDKLKKIQCQLDSALNEYKEFNANNKMLTRATNFDEELNHFIPDLSTIFNSGLFEVAERSILSGLGFIDIAEAVSSSRRESVLNPKAFMEETKKGVKDFKQIIKELVLLIVKKNESHKKFLTSNIRVTSSPITGFMTDKFKERIRQCWDRGKLSNQTAVELIAETDFDIEVRRREKEAKDGIDYTMYPNVTDNREGVSIDFPNQPKPKSQTDHIPDSKVDPVEKKNFDMAKKNKDDLEGSPFKTIKDLPKRATENLNIDLQRVFLSIVNRAFQTYQNESLAFRTSWAVIHKIGRKNKIGIWVRKSKRENGKLVPVQLTTSMIEESIKNSEKDAIDEAFTMKNLEMTDGKKALLKKLFKN